MRILTKQNAHIALEIMEESGFPGSPLTDYPYLTNRPKLNFDYVIVGEELSYHWFCPNNVSVHGTVFEPILTSEYSM